MKAYLTALTPAARLTVWKALGIALLAALAEVWRFTTSFCRQMELQEGVGLKDLAETAGLYPIFGTGLVLLCAILVLPGMERSARTGYTFRRLPVDERVVTTLWGAQNTLVLLFYWGSQIAVFLALANWYLQTAPAELVTQQTLVLTCYQTPYLHSLLPMADWPVLVRNLIGCAMLGFSTAVLSFHWRNGRKAFSTLPLTLVAVLAFPVGLDNLIPTLLQLAVCLDALYFTIYGVWRWHGNDA